MLIEDDPIGCFLLSEFLIGEGYWVDSIESALDMFFVITKTEPDLILLDLRLPDRDGFDVLRALKNDRIFCRIPVIVVSAMSKKSDIDHAIGLGAKHYLLKPFDLNILLKAVEFELRAIGCRKSRDIDRIVE